MDQKDRKQQNEVKLTGQPASAGLIIGPLQIYRRSNVEVKKQTIKSSEIEDEIFRYDTACGTTIAELSSIFRMEEETSNGDPNDILDAQIEIVKDPELKENVHDFIKTKHYKADFAVSEAFHKYLFLIESTGNQFLIDRLVDIREVRDRLIRHLQKKHHNNVVGEKRIIVTEEITPSEILEFSKRDVLGIVCDQGGTTSHAAIIANAMGIPLVLGTGRATRLAIEGKKAILDANKGIIVFNPTEESLQEYRKALVLEVEKLHELEEVVVSPSRTSSGESYVLRANIEFEQELPNIEKFRAEGVGLLRTESMLMSDGNHPDSESQEQFYKKVMECTNPHPVTIRLFDVGGDKILNLKYRESNPFLGWRGIRVLLDRPEVLRGQIRAILKASGSYENRVKLLIPMVSSLEEVLAVEKIVDETKEQLHREGHPFDKKLKIGIMIEVPATALQAAHFAKYVDFFSIGTNDLTQYTLAVDRGNNLISSLYRQMHPAVWKLIRMTIDAARKQGIEVAICGELASNPFGALCLLGMGIRDLSMVPAILPKVKKVLNSHTLDQMKSWAKKVENAESFSQVQSVVNEWKKLYGIVL